MAKTYKEKKKRFWKWLLALSVSAVILGAPALYFGGKYYLRQRTLGWRTQGMTAYAAKNYDAASDLLARYIRRNPQDQQALDAFIDAREQTDSVDGRNIADTISALKLSLSNDPANLDHRRHLLDLYVKIQRRPEALDTANTILAKLPTDAHTLAIKTEILTAMHQDREALSFADQWAAADPGAIEPQMARITARFQLRQDPQAILNGIQTLAEKTPNDPKLELLLGYTFGRLENKEDEALRWLKASASHSKPGDPHIPTLIAQFDALGVGAETIAMLEDLVKRGADLDVRHTLAKRLWEQGQWERAAAQLADVDPAQPRSDPNLLALRAICLANLGKTPESSALRAALAARKQPAAAAWTLLLPRILDAAQVDDTAVVNACRQAVALDLKNAHLAYYLGDACARLGALDLAIESWALANAVAPSWAMPSTRLVEALLQSGKTEDAFVLADRAAKRSPTNAGAVVALAHAWAAGVEQGSVGQAGNLLNLVDEVQQQIPGEERTLIIRINLLGRASKNPQAIDAIRAALAAKNPPSQNLCITLAAVSRKYNLGVEEECFARSEALYKVTVELAYARAVNRFVAGDAAGGLKLFDAQASAAGASADLSWKLARARYLDMTGSPDASAALEALGDAFPKDMAVQTTLIGARALRGNWNVLPKTIERLKALSTLDDTKAKLADAQLHIEAAKSEDDYVQGSRMASEIIAANPPVTAARDAHILLAHALVRMKRIDGALEHLTIASQIDRTCVPVAIELAALLRSRGDFERVQQELERIAPNLHTAAERQQAAAVLAQSGAPDKALQLLQQNGSQNVDTANSLFMAMLYRQQNQLDKAETLVKKLLEKPDLETIQFAASLYLSLGRRADAEKALAQLDTIVLEPGLKELIWGSYHFQTGDREKALAQYRLAVDKAPTNSVTWRTLAAIQIVSAKIDDALATLTQAAKANPNDTGLQALAAKTDVLRDANADSGLHAVMLLCLRDPLHSDSAVEMMKMVIDARRASDSSKLAARLQQFIERHSDFLPAYVRLAQCYSDMNRPNDALQTANRAMAVFPNDPEPARVAVQLAAANKRWAEMRSAAETWKKRSNDINADAALARALIGLEQYDAARQQIAPYLPLADANPDQFTQIISLYATIAINQGREKEVADKLLALIKVNPSWRYLWVDLALGIKDPKQATAWLNRIAAMIPADATREKLGLAEAYDRVGRSGKDPAAIEHATALTVEIATAAEKDIIAQLTAAAQTSRVGDATGAEKFYRRALTLDPNQWIANNNLAMLVLARKGDPKEALALAQAAARDQPASATALDTLAQAQARASNPKAAVDTLTAALKYDPDNLAYQIRLTQYLLDTGDNVQALARYRQLDQTARAGTPISGDQQAEIDALKKRLKQS